MDSFLGISPLKKIYLCREETSTFFTNDCPREEWTQVGVTHVKLIPGCECDIHIYHKKKENAENHAFDVPTRSSSPFLLKSLLQKSIRRGCSSIAQRSARDLMLESPTELIRRLPIIMIEDTGVFYEIVDMVFDLLCGYVLDVIRPLKYATMLAQTKKRSIPKFDTVTFSKKSLFDKCIKNITDVPSMVAFSLLIRASYGGMQGDVNMLVHAAQLVMNSKLPIHSLSTDEYSFNIDNRVLNVSDWILDAVDFHCCPNILGYVTEKTGIHKDAVKKIMWDYGSKINCRDNQSANTSEEWIHISSILQGYRISIIEQSYKSTIMPY